MHTDAMHIAAFEQYIQCLHLSLPMITTYGAGVASAPELNVLCSARTASRPEHDICAVDTRCRPQPSHLPLLQVKLEIGNGVCIVMLLVSGTNAEWYESHFARAW